MLPCLLAHDHDHASIFWIVQVQAVVLLVVLPRQMRAVGITCLWVHEPVGIVQESVCHGDSAI